MELKGKVKEERRRGKRGGKKGGRRGKDGRKRIDPAEFNNENIWKICKKKKNTVFIKVMAGFSCLDFLFSSTLKLYPDLNKYHHLRYVF